MMAANLYCLLFVVLLAVTHAALVPITKISAPENRVKPGEDVTIQCVVPDYKFGSTLVFWKKRQGPDNSEIVQIATNTLIVDDFLNTGRYSIVPQKGTTEVTFSLNIKAAVVEDSGEIGCELPDQDTGLITQKLIVISPVTKLTLYGMKNNDTTGNPIFTYKDKEEVPFAEGEEYFFRCMAEGSNPPADLKISLGEEDITDSFTAVSSSQVGPNGRPGLRKVSNTAMTTTHTALTVTHVHNGMDLRCTANIPESEPISTFIKPLLHFPPTIRKCGKVLRVPRNKLYVHIICVVKAHPAVELDSISWHFFRKDKSNITLHAGESWGHYSVKIENTKMPDEHEVHLVIERAGLPHFKKYFLQARNEMGEVEHGVLLRRDTAHESKGGASSAAASVATVLGLISLNILRRV